MATHVHRPDLINGQLKFSTKQSVDELIQLAIEFKDSSDGDRIRWIAVRGCGESRYAIAFLYQCDGTLKSYDKFVYKLTDQMKRRFGNDVHWDITNDTWLIV